jgi:hypothetical protein
MVAGTMSTAALEGWLIAGLVIGAGMVIELLRRAGRKHNGR